MTTWDNCVAQSHFDMAPAQVLPSPWVLEPIQEKGLLLTSYNLSPPSYHLFPGERDRNRLWWLHPSPQVHGCPSPEMGPWRNELEPCGIWAPL